MNTRYITWIAALCLVACAPKTSQVDLESLKEEVIAAEAAFAAMAESEGLASAFVHFADEEGVIQRNRTVIKGKEAIQAFYEGQPARNETLAWKPDFVEVAAAGDLAWTYGPYTYTVIDSTGESRTSEGVFHTVWKRQADGSWRFVWD